LKKFPCSNDLRVYISITVSLDKRILKEIARKQMEFHSKKSSATKCLKSAIL
jgi:hypothetical protein